LTDTIMSDTITGIAKAFPDTLQIFRRDRKMTFGDHVNYDPNDWRVYIRADAAQARIDAAVRAERERRAYDLILGTKPKEEVNDANREEEAEKS
jgi:hypothetical protein